MKNFILRAWEGLGPACFALFTLSLWTSCLRCVHTGHSSRVLNLCWNSQPVYIIIQKGYLLSCFHIPFVPPALYFLLSILKFIKYFLNHFLFSFNLHTWLLILLAETACSASLPNRSHDGVSGTLSMPSGATIMWAGMCLHCDSVNLSSFESLFLRWCP